MQYKEILAVYSAKFLKIDPEFRISRRGLKNLGLKNYTTWAEVLESLYLHPTVNTAAQSLHYGMSVKVPKEKSAEKGMVSSLDRQSKKILGVGWAEALGKSNNKTWKNHIEESIGIKTCTQCKSLKPLSEYPRLNDISRADKYNTDVYMGACNECYKPIHAGHAKKWKDANPDIVLANAAARRAKMSMKGLSDYEKQEIYAIYSKSKNLNTEAGFIKYHVDHIKPLSKGGKHHPSNLQILLAEENLRKSDKYEESKEWVDTTP